MSRVARAGDLILPADACAASGVAARRDREHAPGSAESRDRANV